MTSRRVLLFVLAASLTDCKSPTAPASAAVSPPSTAGRHIVTVPGDGVALGGILFPPEAAGVRPAIVVLHGWQPAGTNGAAVVEARARQYRGRVRRSPCRCVAGLRAGAPTTAG